MASIDYTWIIRNFWHREPLILILTSTFVNIKAPKNLSKFNIPTQIFIEYKYIKFLVYLKKL